METKINSSSGRRAKKTETNRNAVWAENSENNADNAEAVPDITGALLENSFVAGQRLDISSGEADIYECTSSSGERLILKYYRRTDAIKESVLDKLREMKSPYVPPVYAAGVYQGHQYVIMPRYQKRSLADELAAGKRFTFKELKTRIIPSVNEALKVIHEAGIIHKDLKPANLIPDDDGQRIVVIDFGISSYADKGTLVKTSTGMTPVYAAPEALHGLYHRASDYYSLGITVFELFTGYTPFQMSGVSDEELVQMASVNKISFPENFPEKLQNLVLGLTYKDISSRNEQDNPNRRWGYDEVRRWLNGEDVPVPGKGTSSGAGSASSPFPPYKFNDKTYTAEIKLLRAMLEHPEEGIKDLGRGFISRHYGLYDKGKAAIVRLKEKEMEHSPGREYGVFCSLMYHLNPSVNELYAGGRAYQSMEDLAKALLKAVNQANGSRLMRHAVSLLRSEFLLDYYARQIVENKTYEEILSRIKEHMQRRSFSETELACLLGWSFSQERSFRAGNIVFQNPDDFREKMRQMLKRNPKEYQNYIFSAREELLFVRDFIPDPNARFYIEEALKARADIRKTGSGESESQGSDAKGKRGPGILQGLAEFARGFGHFITDLRSWIIDVLRRAANYAGFLLNWYPGVFWCALAAIVFAIAGVFWKLLSAGSSPDTPEIIEPAPEQYLSRGFVLEQQNEKALALEYFEKACQGDIAKGCTKAAWHYQYGIGIPEADYSRAREFYETSCNLNDGMGCSGLGWLFQQGQGGGSDYDKAREYYQKGCQLDNGSGCTGLGNLYRYGLGVSKDPAGSRNYFEKACQLGHHKGCAAIQE